LSNLTLKISYNIKEERNPNKENPGLGGKDKVFQALARLLNKGGEAGTKLGETPNVNNIG